MKRIIWILTIVGLCLALVVSGCAAPLVPEETEEFLVYTNMLEQAGVPDACQEAGIDFEETFVVPCQGEVPDGYSLLSLLFDSFGETDLWFAATALELYKGGAFTPGDLKALAVGQWKSTDGDEDEASLEIFITENWKKEKIYQNSANIMMSEHWKREKVYHFYPSSLAAFLLATGNVHGGYSSILIEPETATNNVGETHTVMAEVWLWTVDGLPICRITGHMVDFLVAGSHSESASITTDSEGEATFSYPGTNVGKDTITAITVIDGMQLTATATKIWEPVAIPVPSISLSPNTATNTVGESHTVILTCWLGQTPIGAPSQVTFSVSGANTASASITTDSQGEATFSYQGKTVGEDTITAITVIDGMQLTATANKTWEAAPGLPPTPTLISPPNSSVDVDSDGELEWLLSSGATSYHLQVATEATFVSPIVDSVIPMTSYSISSELSYDTSYYWRVQACNEYGCSAWSEVWSFQTGSPAPPL